MLRYLIRRKKREADINQLLWHLVEGKEFRDRDFTSLCSSIKMPRARLDNMLYDMVGMSGDDIMLHLQ